MDDTYELVKDQRRSKTAEPRMRSSNVLHQAARIGGCFLVQGGNRHIRSARQRVQASENLRITRVDSTGKPQRDVDLNAESNG